MDFIKLNKSMLDHWLYKESRPLTRREAWENMLLMASSETKSLINGELVTFEKGKLLNDICKYADMFGWEVEQVTSFFKLLEADNMIINQGMITICEYEKYIDKPAPKKQPVKKLFEEPEFDFKKSLIRLGVDEIVVNDYLAVRKAKKGVNTFTSFKTIKAEIEKSGYSANECITLAVKRNWVGIEAEWIKKSMPLTIKSDVIKSKGVSDEYA